MKDQELRDKLASEYSANSRHLKTEQHFKDGWDAARAAQAHNTQDVTQDDYTNLRNERDQLRAEVVRLTTELDHTEKVYRMNRGFVEDSKGKIAELKAAAEKLAEALYDNTYNCVRETLALMSEGEGDNAQTYREMAKHALTRLDKALAEYRKKFPKR